MAGFITEKGMANGWIKIITRNIKSNTKKLSIELLNPTDSVIVF